MTLYDISRPLGVETPVWPGDVPVRLELTMARPDAPVDTRALHTTVHAGTHLDAPTHVIDGGVGTDAVELDRCIGPALLVDVGDAPVIDLAELPPLQGVQRVLFKTRRSGLPTDCWPDRFAALTPAAALSLADAGLRLVGVDTPSVDPPDSEDLPAHRVLLGRGVAILENLQLADVPPGRYELIALPLKLVDADASPVRAVLRTLEGEA